MRYHIRAKPVRASAVRGPGTIVTVLAAAFAALDGCANQKRNLLTGENEWGGCQGPFASKQALDALSRRGTTGNGGHDAGDDGSKGGAGGC